MNKNQTLSTLGRNLDVVEAHLEAIADQGIDERMTLVNPAISMQTVAQARGEFESVGGKWATYVDCDNQPLVLALWGDDLEVDAAMMSMLAVDLENISGVRPEFGAMRYVAEGQDALPGVGL